MRLELAKEACEKDADARDVLVLYGAFTNCGAATALVDKALETFSEAGAKADASVDVKVGDDVTFDLDADVDVDVLEQLCC